MFLGAIKSQKKMPRDKVAILASGASRLAYDLSAMYSSAYAVDNCVPAVLLVKEILSGKKIELLMNFPSDSYALKQQRIKIPAGQVKRRKNIQVIVADIHRLPFESDSLDTVITQYVLDIIPNHTLLFLEIHRVLKKGGVWINLGIPGFKNMADQNNHLNLSNILSEAGFKLQKKKLMLLPHLELYEFSRLYTTMTRATLFFVAEK